jgi:hypothetical protein
MEKKRILFLFLFLFLVKSKLIMVWFDTALNSKRKQMEDSSDW